MSPLDRNWIEKLVDKKVISPASAQEILGIHSSTGKDLVDIILKLEVIEEETLFHFISEELGIPYVNLDTFVIDLDAIILVPENTARVHRIVPLFKIKDILTVATSKPAETEVLDILARETSCIVDCVLATPSAISRAIERVYKEVTRELTTIKELAGADASVANLLEVIDIERRPESERNEIDLQSIQRMADEAPLIKLVNLIIVKAIEEGASDIHIEPEAERSRVRYRLDGLLHEVESLPKKLHLPIVSRIKVMSGLDIIEARKPQDGRISVRLGKKEVDLRVSIFPTVLGNKVVMRILDKTQGLPPLDKLGFPPASLKVFRELIHRPHGVILITGPTGSGKTSTLYAALREINSPEINITTLEDPVEYKIEGINQGQINPRFGLTFAAGLRSILRQDPNVILVGEMRDTETAEIAIRASLTGHLVFSTLHTNDAVGAITRLIDMGIERFLVASSLSGILAQRLVRKICLKCQESYQPSKEALKFFEETSSNLNIEFRRGKGCSACRDTGYKGRIGIFELLVINDQIRELILERKPVDIIKQVAIDSGMKTLYQDGLEKVYAGITTIEEVMSVTVK